MELTNIHLEILHFLYKCRYATSKQLARLYFTDSLSSRTATRRTNLVTKKMASYGLIHHLKRRIGGVRAGSGSYVWSITYKGIKELRKYHPNTQLKLRNTYEPTAHHPEHTLAVTEVYVKLKELEKQGSLEIDTFSFEPTCHRGFANFTHSFILKPDAFTHLALQNEELLLFVELDKDTESLNRIINQCKKYIKYFSTGIEQRLHDGVFPLVLWIVPNEKRRQNIKQRIQDELNSYWQLFDAITLDDFMSYILGGENGKEFKDNY